MDLTAYYQKIRATQASIADAYPVVVSLATADGGKEGVLTEVTREIAAKMIVEGEVELATSAETAAFRASSAAAKKATDQAAAASKVQFSVLTTAELNKLKGVADDLKDPG
jgi:prolyl-tRNA synthetase